MGSKKQLETIDPDTLDTVIGGAYTAAALSSQELHPPVTQRVTYPPWAGDGAESRGTGAPRTPPMGT
jgi:hypothetical protein